MFIWPFYCEIISHKKKYKSKNIQNNSYNANKCVINTQVKK